MTDENNNAAALVQMFSDALDKSDQKAVAISKILQDEAWNTTRDQMIADAHYQYQKAKEISKINDAIDTVISNASDDPIIQGLLTQSDNEEIVATNDGFYNALNYAVLKKTVQSTDYFVAVLFPFASKTWTVKMVYKCSDISLDDVLLRTVKAEEDYSVSGSFDETPDDLRFAYLVNPDNPPALVKSESEGIVPLTVPASVDYEQPSYQALSQIMNECGPLTPYQDKMAFNSGVFGDYSVVETVNEEEETTYDVVFGKSKLARGLTNHQVAICLAFALYQENAINSHIVMSLLQADKEYSELMTAYKTKWDNYLSDHDPRNPFRNTNNLIEQLKQFDLTKLNHFI